MTDTEYWIARLNRAMTVRENTIEDH